MSKSLLAALALVWALVPSSFGMEPGQTYGYATRADLWNAPQPSGLRFGASEISVRTADEDGVEVASAAPGGCPTCCGPAGCIDWKLRPWNTSEPYEGYKHWFHGCHGGGCQ